MCKVCKVINYNNILFLEVKEELHILITLYPTTHIFFVVSEGNVSIFK